LVTLEFAFPVRYGPASHTQNHLIRQSRFLKGKRYSR
jgi:hypothetical protein